MRPNISSILRALPGAENLLDRAEGGGAPGCFSVSVEKCAHLPPEHSIFHKPAFPFFSPTHSFQEIFYPYYALVQQVLYYTLELR